ncbi:hypothetical protein D9M72_464330 [compost metagenome]
MSGRRGREAEIRAIEIDRRTGLDHGFDVGHDDVDRESPGDIGFGAARTGFRRHDKAVAGIQRGIEVDGARRQIRRSSDIGTGGYIGDAKRDSHADAGPGAARSRAVGGCRDALRGGRRQGKCACGNEGGTIEIGFRRCPVIGNRDGTCKGDVAAAGCRLVRGIAVLVRVGEPHFGFARAIALVRTTGAGDRRGADIAGQSRAEGDGIGQVTAIGVERRVARHIGARRRVHFRNGNARALGARAAIRGCRQCQLGVGGQRNGAGYVEGAAAQHFCN